MSNLQKMQIPQSAVAARRAHDIGERGRAARHPAVKAVLNQFPGAEIVEISLDGETAMEKHDYMPSAMHMGDCNICGHLQDHPNHRR
jgi:hypothetical protein